MFPSIIFFKKSFCVTVLVAAIFGSFLSVSFAQSSDSLQETIDALIAQVQQLQEQVHQQATDKGLNDTEYIWSRNLKIGDRGEDVQKLQEFLNTDSVTQVSIFGEGSPGSETSYFGPATARALKKFQEQYYSDILTPNNLKEGNGFFGVSTRAKLIQVINEAQVVVENSQKNEDSGTIDSVSAESESQVQEVRNQALSTSPVRVEGVPTCSESQMEKLLAPATVEADAYRPKCNPTLTSSDVITKRIFLERENASGIVFDCNGATLDGSSGTFNYGKDMILVRSNRVNGQWSRPTDITIKNCTVKGGMRIHGMGITGGNDYIHESSFSLGHIERQQAAAPTRILIEDVTFIGQNRIPLFLSPGVTYTTVRNVTFAGTSNSTSVYLAPESAYNTFIDNNFTINPKSSREVFAVDGSAHNIIKDNKFSGLNKGGIFLYRNCGESGTVRHQTPQYNEITGNEFYYNKYKGELPAIWLGSRTGNARSYCGDDAGYDFGSSIDNASYAENNIVTGNKIVKLSADKMIRNSNPPNTINGNGTIAKRGDSLPSAVTVEPAARTICPLYSKPLCEAGEMVETGRIDENGCEAAPQCVVDTQSMDSIFRILTQPDTDAEDNEIEGADSDSKKVSEGENGVDVEDEVAEESSGAGLDSLAVGVQVISVSSHTTKNRLTVFFSGLKGQGKGINGKVIAGPGNYGGKVWWEVEYENGISAWSPADRLEVLRGEVLGVSTSVDLNLQLSEALRLLTSLLTQLK